MVLPTVLASLQKLVRWTVAYCKALMLYSRQQSDDASVAQSLAGVLYPYELRQLQQAGPNYPQFALQVRRASVRVPHAHMQAAANNASYRVTQLTAYEG